MGTAAPSHMEREEVLTDDTSCYSNHAKNQISTNLKHGHDLFQGDLREQAPPAIDGKRIRRQVSHQHPRPLSNRARLRRRQSPPTLLAVFLESRTRPNQPAVKRLNKLDLGSESWDVTLPGILLRYLFLTQHSQVRAVL